MPPETFVERVREYANKVYKIVVELLQSEKAQKSRRSTYERATS